LATEVYVNSQCSMSRMLVLSATDLQRVLPMPAAIEAMEEAFALNSDEFQIPVRSQFPLRESNGIFLLMPAHAARLGKIGTKLVSVFPGNASRGIDPVQASYLLFSGEDGRLLSIMDGKYITAVRTAATSAVATKWMARKSASRLSIFGTGTQAIYHLRAVSLVRPIAEARICGLTTENSAAFVRAWTQEFPFPLLVSSSNEAAAQADILCTCTDSSLPVFQGSVLKEGTHINAVGAFRPNTRELDDDVVRSARIVVDTMDGAMAEAGDILIPLAGGALAARQIVGDLAQVIAGEAASRLNEGEITIFKSVGFALQDLVAGIKAYESALQSGLGREINL